MTPEQARKALPARIKVRVTEDVCGGVLVRPVSPTIRHLVGLTNEHNGDCDFYMQDSRDVNQFLCDYPQARYRVPCRLYWGYKIGRYTYEVNNGAIFLMDSWEFRHMVGGQCD